MGLFKGRHVATLRAAASGPTYSLECSAASFTLTGIDATLKHSSKLTASAGSFTLTGVDAGLYAARKLSASVGEFTLTGIAAGLRAARKLSASAASFTLTGVDATLTYAAAGAHRYWRVYVTAVSGGSSRCAIAEVEMHTTPLGSDVCSGGTPSASSNYAGHPATDAFDDSTTTYWMAIDTSVPQWLAYDFGAGNDKNIVEVAIRHYSAASGKPPVEFKIQYSDNDADWYDLLSYTGQEAWDVSSWRFYRTVSDRYEYRINVDNPTYNPRIAEMQMRLVAAGADQCSGGTATAESTYSTYVAANAFDDDGATYWRSSAQAAWLQYQFTSPKAIVEYVVQAATSGGQDYAPRTWTFESWNGATGTWTVLDTQTLVAAWSSGESRTYSAELPPDYSLVCNAGALTLTGNSAGLYAGRKLSGSAGSFTLTGNVVGLSAGRKLSGSAGTFTLAGVDALLTVSRGIAAGVGAFTLTGVDAGLRAAHAMPVSAGAFTLTGNSAGLSKTTIFAVSAGAFTLTGVDAGLRAARKLSPSVGAFTLTGIDAGLLRHIALATSVGEFTLTGVDAGLKAGYKLAPSVGEFTLTGMSANFPYGTTTYSIETAVGTFVLTGNSVHVLQQQPPQYRPRVPTLGPPPPNIRDIQHPLWREWHRKVRMAVVSPASVSFSLVAVGAEVTSTATSGGYGAASAAEYDALVEQIAALRKALLDNGIAVP